MKRAKQIITSVQQKISYTHNDIGSLLGWNKSFFDEARGARIILYHGICLNDPMRFNNIFLPLKTFREHIHFYKEHFHIISLNDFYQKRFDPDRFNICISFDDGYANNYKYVLPILEDEKIPATFFITAIREAGHDILWNDFMGIMGKHGPAEIVFRNEVFRKNRHNSYLSVKTSASLKDTLRAGGFAIKEESMRTLYQFAPFRDTHAEDDYWLQMTESQIRELAASKWATIGSHGYYHNDLSKMSAREAESEMIQSKEYLEKITGNDISAIAFPYGSYTREVVAAAKRAGFIQLLATDFLFDEDSSDDTMRERFTVNPFISVNNQMIANIKGTYATRSRK